MGINPKKCKFYTNNHIKDRFSNFICWSILPEIITPTSIYWYNFG